MKKCTKCGEEKPLEEFYKSKKKSKKTGEFLTSSSCKRCSRAIQSKWRKDNPERRRKATDCFRTFCEEYGGDAFSLGWSTARLECIEKIENYKLVRPKAQFPNELYWALVQTYAGVGAEEAAREGD